MECARMYEYVNIVFVVVELPLILNPASLQGSDELFTTPSLLK
jgi:hypothetical protein